MHHRPTYTEDMKYLQHQSSFMLQSQKVDKLFLLLVDCIYTKRHVIFTSPTRRMHQPHWTRPNTNCTRYSAGSQLAPSPLLHIRLSSQIDRFRIRFQSDVIPAQVLIRPAKICIALALTLLEALEYLKNTREIDEQCFDKTNTNGSTTNAFHWNHL